MRRHVKGQLVYSGMKPRTAEYVLAMFQPPEELMDTHTHHLESEAADDFHHLETKTLELGAHVVHPLHGSGVVKELLEDGRTLVRFKNGEEHNYTHTSLVKLHAESEGDRIAEMGAADIAKSIQKRTSVVLESLDYMKQHAPDHAQSGDHKEAKEPTIVAAPLAEGKLDAIAGKLDATAAGQAELLRTMKAVVARQMALLQVMEARSGVPASSYLEAGPETGEGNINQAEAITPLDGFFKGCAPTLAASASPLFAARTHAYSCLRYGGSPPPTMPRDGACRADRVAGAMSSLVAGSAHARTPPKDEGRHDSHVDEWIARM